MPRRRKPAPRRTPEGWAGEAAYPTLDLHGETADDARRRAERWLLGQQAAGANLVRIITGRGVHSVGPPVLRGEIQEMLEGMHGGVVSHFTSEAGGGAFRVEISRPERPRRPGGPSYPRYADPELIRRAEDALWELGVAPTPTLIQAEIRRILSL